MAYSLNAVRNDEKGEEGDEKWERRKVGKGNE